MKLTSLTPILNVSDLCQSIAWFEKLGWKGCWTWNHAGMIEGAAGSNAAGPATFGAVANGEVEIFLCKGAQGSRGGPMPKHVGDDDTGGVWMSWWLKTSAEVNAAHELAVQNGLTVTFPPTDEPWGCREWHLRHPDGHTFRIAAALDCK